MVASLACDVTLIITQDRLIQYFLFEDSSDITRQTSSHYIWPFLLAMTLYKYLFLPMRVHNVE